ncbi:MAG: fructokinase [Paraglaciecola sp.]|jgi:fructokinase
MKKILCFGEALVDMLSNALENEHASQETFTKFAGGAPANVSVAVAKLGGNAYFCGMLSSDIFGRFLLSSLQSHGVNTDYVPITEQAKTALAFVSLDAHGERTFEFYRDNTADLCFRADDFTPAWFNDCGVFHFCSNTLTDTNISLTTQKGVALAKAQGCVVSFDINLRTNLWPVSRDPRASILPLLEHCDMIKASKEELECLAQGQSVADFIEQTLNGGCQLFIVTDGGNPVHWYTATGKQSFTPIKVNMVDATAAGDAFVGGLLYQLGLLDLTATSFAQLCIKTKDILPIIEFASACGAHAASAKGAFTSLPSQQSLTAFRSAI